MLSSFWCCRLCATTCTMFNIQYSTFKIFFQFPINSTNILLVPILPLLVFLVCTRRLLRMLHCKPNEYARLSCASSPCLCPCSSSHTSDSGSGCCSSGWHLQHRAKISRCENRYFSLHWHKYIWEWGCARWRTRKGGDGVFSSHTWEIWRTSKKSCRGEGAESRICVTQLTTSSRISKPPCFCSIYHLWRTRQLVEQSSEKRQRIYNCNSKYFVRGRPMIKFISFCPKMINSADFVIPTIMPTQWLFFPLKYEY